MAGPERPPASAPRPPLIPGPVETATLFWRWLRRMRTALYLLGVLGLAVFVATLVPQEPNVPDTVARWRAGVEGPGEVAAQLMDAAGLFDVFGSPWFVVLLALLFTSLTSCLLPRYRALYRTARHGRPPRARDLGGKPHVLRFVTDRPPDEVLASARTLLAGRRYRLRDDGAGPDRVAPTRSDARLGVTAAPAESDGPAGAVDGRADQVAAERGHLLREGGSLLFHTAFYVLLIGVVVGQLTHFRGQVGVVEGHAFADTPVAYWTTERGRWWSGDDHAGFLLTLDRFDVEWTPDAQPVLFRSNVTIAHPDGRTEQRSTVINDPLVIDGMKVHTLDWGYAPRVVVRDGDQVVHDAFITMTATDAGFWRGAVKAPAADPQVGLDIRLIPTAPEVDGRVTPTGWPDDRAPLLVLTAYEGDLLLDRAQAVTELDTRAMREVATGALRPGFEVELPNGVTVAFPELRRWVGFQVSRRPTDPLLLAAAGLLLTGLLPALYAHRRRVWVSAEAVGDRTVVTVAGHAFQRPQAFDEEFDRLARRLRDTVGVAEDAPAAAAPEPSRQVVGP